MIKLNVQKEFSKETLDGWTDNRKKPEVNLAEIFSQEALRLLKDKRPKEALTLINLSIEREESNPSYYDIKGLVLKDLHKYNSSLKAFDKSLELEYSEEVLLDKINMLYAWANSLNDKNRALELINEAIENTAYISKDLDMEKFWYLKGSILDCLGDKAQSKKCYMIAEKMDDDIIELDEHQEYINTTDDTLISIAGTQFYLGIEVFKQGMIVDLIRDEENEHDPDAIRVEFEGETLGYVANSPHTLIEGVKSASEIKNDNPKKAEVMFLYLFEYVIARLI